nr:copper resistance protein B [uncultured Sphingomonas sp.]
MSLVLSAMLLASAAQCTPEHAAMGHCKMPAAAKPKAAAAKPAPKPKPKPKAAAKPKPAVKAPARPAPRASTSPSSAAAAPGAAPIDPSCPPEHAAMGHCTPKTSAAQQSAPAAAAAPAPAPAPAAAAATDPDCLPEHAAMGHCTPKATSPAVSSAPMGKGGTALPAGNAPAPAAPEANYADRVWGRDAMAPARTALRREHGGMSYSQLMLNLAEVQFRDGRDGYRWDGEFWYGGDINRLTIKSEGEGTFRENTEGEVQALYSRAVGPYFNLQAGVRQDFGPGPDRTYATVGFEGLAPYWFDVEGALFLSDKGDVFGRLEGYYDQRITQRLVLQPRVELNLSAQDVPSSGLGSGLTDAEAGLRLRYEIKREFAPYVGVSWERRLGDTARYARAAGEGTGGFSVVAGVRAWF